MHLFWCPEINTQAVLSEEESKHAANVLRLNSGDKIQLTDGKGTLADATLISVNSRQCIAEINSSEIYPVRKRSLHIAIAPVKQTDRLEWFLEKATETGIEYVTPVVSRYSERKEIRIDRLEKLIVSACKQSRQVHFPVLNPLVKFDDFIKSDISSKKFIATCADVQTISLNMAYDISDHAVIMIGPEGDFSDTEIDSAVKSGFIPVNFGTSRLRTETAGLYACMAFAYQLNSSAK